MEGGMARRMSAKMAAIIVALVAAVVGGAGVVEVEGQAAMAPAPPFVNVTDVLQNGGQFTTFLSLLQATNAASLLQGAVNQSLAQTTSPGITLFVPTDAAFAARPAATLLRGLNASQQASLVFYHALQRYYPMSSLQQSDGNVTATYATYNGGASGGYALNVSVVQGTVSLATGYDVANITNTLYDSFPCAIFGLNAVLLPTDIFGVPVPAPAPSPLPEPPSSSSSSSSPNPAVSIAEPPSNPAPTSATNLLVPFLLLLPLSLAMF